MGSLDRARKMPLYAQQGVKNFWLVDPIEKTLEVYENNMGKWLLLHTYANDDKVRLFYQLREPILRM